MEKINGVFNHDCCQPPITSLFLVFYKSKQSNYTLLTLQNKSTCHRSVFHSTTVLLLHQTITFSLTLSLKKFLGKLFRKTRAVTQVSHPHQSPTSHGCSLYPYHDPLNRRYPTFKSKQMFPSKI